METWLTRVSPSPISPSVRRSRKDDKTAGLVHDPEKWKPVFGKDHAPMQNLDLDPIHFDRIKV
jgi:hypothetical protein